MKIVNFETFLSLPIGIIFAKYTESGYSFGELCVKGESITETNDFFFREIWSLDYEDTGEFIEKCATAQRGDDILLDFDTESRDAMFNDDQLFAVFSSYDLSMLIDSLDHCCGYDDALI